MAVTAPDVLESVDEPVLRQIEPKPFHWEAVDPEQIIIRYDRPSDTLLIHLFGRGRPSISVSTDRYLHAMVDPDTEEIIGIHIEGFLAHAVKEHPRWIAVLDDAETRGITAAEVRALQRSVLGVWRQLAADVQAALVSPSPPDKLRAITLLLGAEAPRWGVRGVTAA